MCTNRCIGIEGLKRGNFLGKVNIENWGSCCWCSYMVGVEQCESIGMVSPIFELNQSLKNIAELNYSLNPEIKLYLVNSVLPGLNVATEKAL